MSHQLLVDKSLWHSIMAVTVWISGRWRQRLMIVGLILVLVELNTCQSILKFQGVTDFGEAGLHASVVQDEPQNNLNVKGTVNVWSPIGGTEALASPSNSRRCIIRFKNEKMLLCHNERNFSLVQDIQRQLEHHFEGCSAAHIGVKDLTSYPELLFDRICFDFSSKSSLSTNGYSSFHTIKSGNSTAVVIIGNLRGGERTWRSLYKNALDVNSADLLLFIGKTLDRESSMFDRAKFTMEFPEYDDWADAIDIISNGNKTWRKDVPNKVQRQHKKYILLGGALGRPGSGALILMSRWFLRSFIQDYRLDELYDRFIITRSDHYYVCQHSIVDLDTSRAIWIPDGENYFGICDRHVVCNASVVIDVLNLIPPLIESPDRYHFTKAGLTNTERFVEYRWKEMNLLMERFPRVMFTASGPADVSRWKNASTLSIPEGVQLKYLQEYRLAKASCSLAGDNSVRDRGNLSARFPPVGALVKNKGKIFCNKIAGWACDRDAPSAKVIVIGNVTSSIGSKVHNFRLVADQKSLPEEASNYECQDSGFARFSQTLKISSVISEKTLNGPFELRAFALDVGNAFSIIELVGSPAECIVISE